MRKPEEDEKNANLLLIQKGAIAVDFNGNELKTPEYQTLSIFSESTMVKEPEKDKGRQDI